MTALHIIAKYYEPGSLAYDVLVTHSECVVRKALEAAARVASLKPDLAFIEQAAMLHDIGMIRTQAPEIGCHGEHPYIQHGVLGRAMLETEGLPAAVALVCERHTGTGLSVEDIRRGNMPLPLRDMLPVSLEERIICYADKFFSKTIGRLREERAIGEIERRLSRFGEDKAATFRAWHAQFGG